MKTNNILTTAILAAAGLVLSSTSASADNTPYELGNIMLGFQATGGLGVNNYVIANLGTASAARDATGNISLFSGTALGSALAANFGATWYDRTDLFVGAAMGFEDDEFGPNSGGLNGDPFNTNYASNKRSAVGTAGTANSAPWNPTPNATIGASSAMLDSANRFLATGLGVATIAKSSFTNDWDNRNPVDGLGVQGVAFNTFAGGVQSAFDTGLAGVLSGYSAEAMLDLYRIQSDTVSTVGTSFEGTIVIDSTGEVSLALQAVPEPSTLGVFGFGTGLAALLRRRRGASAKA